MFIFYKLIIIDQVWDKFYNIHTHEDNSLLWSTI